MHFCINLCGAASLVIVAPLQPRSSVTGRQGNQGMGVSLFTDAQHAQNFLTAVPVKTGLYICCAAIYRTRWYMFVVMILKI